MIVLNEFIPERWAMRAHAGAVDENKSKARQLLKAQTIISSIDQRSYFISSLLKKYQNEK